MKSLILLTSFFSFSINACPDLSGTYPTCRSITGTSEVSPDLIITQEVRNNVTTYVMSHTDETRETFIADGVERLDEIGYGIQILDKSQCIGDSLIAVVKLLSHGEEFADLQMNVTKSGKRLTVLIEGRSEGNPIKDTIICE